jgi:hypothetical protein
MGLVKIKDFLRNEYFTVFSNLFRTLGTQCLHIIFIPPYNV